MILLTSAALAFPVERAEACSPTRLRSGERELFFVSTSPAGEPFSYIGHAALWVRDPSIRVDHVLEFGAINSKIQEPLSALLLGNLKCWWLMGGIDKRLSWYRKTGRRVFAHPIVLPESAEDEMFARLHGIIRDLDQSYTFHWRTRNCATEVRDVLDEVLDGQLSAQLTGPAPLTPRQEVLRYLSAHPWAWAGWHHQAGPQADVAMTEWEAAFVPERLVSALIQTPIRRPDGTQAPILGEPCMLNDGRYSWAEPEPPDWTPLLGGLGLLLAGVIGGAGRAERVVLRRLAGGTLMGVGLLAGLLGTMSVVLWAASALTDYGPNENWWLTNPLSWLLIPAGLAVMRGKWTRWLRAGVGVLLALASVGVVLELSPWNVQDNTDFLVLLWPILAAAFLASSAARRPEVKGESTSG